MMDITAGQTATCLEGLSPEPPSGLEEEQLALELLAGGLNEGQKADKGF
jgi:hypothetical protein